MTTLRKYKNKFLIAVAVIALVIVSFFIYGYSTNGYTFHNIQIKSSTLPKDFNNFTIAYFSDLHLKSEQDITLFKKITDDLNKKNYNMVLFGGDLYEKDIISAAKVQKIIKSIKSSYGKFAVLGDEDQTHKSEVTQILNEGGFEVLSDASRTVYYKKSQITLTGYSIQATKPLTKSTNYTVSLSHYPDFFKETSKQEDLHISGHSGGGYIYLPFIGSLYKDSHCKTYHHGSYQKDKATLLVSNGLGLKKDLHMKFLAKNEVLLITLKN